MPIIYDISKPKSEANVSARALASIKYSNNTTAMNEVINYLINNI